MPEIEVRSEAEEPTLLSRVRGFLAPRARTLGLAVPVHLIAFTLLYLATAHLLEQEVVDATSETARERLAVVASQLGLVARTQRLDERGGGHPFDALLETQDSIQLRLFLPGGQSIGPDQAPSRREHDEMVSFLMGSERERFWLSEEGGRREMRGLIRVQSDRSCAPCHPPRATLAAASMTMDLSERIGRVHAHARRNLALLILAWAGGLGITTTLVKRSARRSASRLEAELAAAEAGESAPAQPQAELLLDPTTAELHRSLLDFLHRRRRREAEVASRLVQTDRLASLGQLAAGLAHEIKNPLAGIQGALEILREDLGGDRKNVELCDDMLGELGRINQTLQLLLSSARPSPPQPVETEVAALLEEVRRLAEPGLKRRGVTLEMETAPGLSPARLDPSKIRQALINLITNASEAMENGGRVRVRAGGFPEGDGVILAIEDDGPGIPAEQLKKIFDPFFTTKFSGTGLGLAISQSLVEQHGGRLEVESEPGRGSTFYILLPARQEEAVTAD